jgi:hypothetical protein
MGEKSLKDEIIEILKAEGLDIGEEAAVVASKVAFKVIKLSVTKANPAIGAVVCPIIDMIEPKVMAELDKIDGKDDPGR